MKDKKNIETLKVLPIHESGVRRMVSDAKGLTFHPLHSLEEAKSVPDSVVIFEGDYGGQIYLVCPASIVNCSVEALQQLLEDIDRLMWKDMSGAQIFYERHPVGTGIFGGMGGGIVTEDLWIHDKVTKLKLESKIRELMAGQCSRIK